jgi:hypothetical protein
LSQRGASFLPPRNVDVAIRFGELFDAAASTFAYGGITTAIMMPRAWRSEQCPRWARTAKEFRAVVIPLVLQRLAGALALTFSIFAVACLRSSPACAEPVLPSTSHRENCRRLPAVDAWIGARN